MSTLPTIHLNGTGPAMLREGYEAAWRALGDAETALQAVEFNARDYYVQGPEAWKAARAERSAQFEAIARIRAELMAILEHVQDAIDARARQQEGRA